MQDSVSNIIVIAAGYITGVLLDTSTCIYILLHQLYGYCKLYIMQGV